MNLDLDFLNDPIDPGLRKIVIPVMRKYWRYSKAKDLCIRLARVKRGSYRCNMCKVETFKRNDLEVDHIDAARKLDSKKVTTWYDLILFISRLWVSVDKLQALCKPCHEVKTSLETKMRKHYRNEKKLLDKLNKE